VLEHTIDVLEDLAPLIFELIGDRLGNVTDGNSLPVDGQMRAFARQGRDVWIAIAITTGVGIGVSAFIVGLSAIQG
jgi:hypothetical protein